MLLALMNKAREVGDHEIQPADTVVSMFRKQNAHRAKQNFQSRSAKNTISQDLKFSRQNIHTF